MNSHNIIVANEIINALPDKKCCIHSFLAGFLSGCKQKGGSANCNVLKGLEQKEVLALKSLLTKENQILLQSGKLNISNIEIKDYRCKFTERLKKIVLEGRVKHCLIAFMSGLFLRSGYMQNPDSGYHIEIRTQKKWVLAAIKIIGRQLKIPFNYCSRKNYRIAYLKSIKSIIKFMNKLNLFSISLDLSDIRTTKKLFGRINRQVNFETANINRVVNAADEAIENIEGLLAYENQEIWSETLRATALMRVEYPLDSLEQLGKRFMPIVSKSAINHRLRRINSLHKKLLDNKSENNE